MTSMARTAAGTLCLVVSLLSLASTAQAQAPLLEVEKSDATKLLQVTDDAGFLVRGALDVGTIPAAGAGVRLMWYPGKAAFRAGRVDGSEWDEDNIGEGSVALGVNTRATGVNSLALNIGTEASGAGSIAGGRGSIASGATSLAVGQTVEASGHGAAAFGSRTVASGVSSFAAGDNAKATGPASAALGVGTQALGAASVALGSVVTARGDGSFVFGDRNINSPIEAGSNTFAVRAHGGISLYVSGAYAGCTLPASTGAWECSSSKLLKEEFEEVDGEDVLARLKEVPIQSWRYIGTSARHIGPFAEDFRAAFGLGGSPDKIAQIDADGVALRAVQALEQRTAALQEETAALRAANAALQADNSAIRSELAALRGQIPTLADQRFPITTTTEGGR